MLQLLGLLEEPVEWQVGALGDQQACRCREAAKSQCDDLR